MSDFTVSLSTVWFVFLLSVLAPVITGFITKRFADSKTKEFTLLVVTVLFAVLAQIGQSFKLSEFLTQLVIMFFTSVGLHYGFLKKVGVTGSQGIVNKTLPDFGIGGNYRNAPLPEAKGGPGDDADLSDLDPGDFDPEQTVKGYDPQNDEHI